MTEFRENMMKQNIKVKAIIFLAILINFTPIYAEQRAQETPIKVLDRSAPKYPTMALLNKTEGWVKVEFTIDENGNVKDPIVVDAQPRKIFDLAAIEAVKKFKFTSRLIDGKPISTRVFQTIEFKLPDNILNAQPEIDNNPITVDSILAKIKSGQKLPNENVVMLVKTIKAESTIKTHKRSLSELEIEIIPNKKGFPSSTKVIKNTYRKKLSGNQIQQFRTLGLKQAQMAYELNHGYYNPIFRVSHAKTQPARIIPTLEAKSMPLPEFSKELTFKSKVTLNEKGILVKAVNSNFDGQPLSQELALIFLQQFSFFKAMKSRRPIEDELNLSITFSLVQKTDINSIRKSLFEND